MGLFDFFNKKKHTLLEDIKIASDWISAALNSSGYNADFTLESFKEIDRFISDNSSNGSPKGLLLEGTGKILFAFGAYIGEVIIKNNHGCWETNDNDPNGEINICVNKDGEKIFPSQKIIKRLKNGNEDSIYDYGFIILK